MSFTDHFSLANIPYGIASDTTHRKPAVATRLHDQVIFLGDLELSCAEDVKQALAQVDSPPSAQWPCQYSLVDSTVVNPQRFGRHPER